MEVESSRSAEISFAAFLSKTSRSSSCDCMAAQWKSAGIFASGKRFQKSSQIINDLAARICLDGVVMKTNGTADKKHFTLPACVAGGFGVLIAQLNKHGKGFV